MLPLLALALVQSAAPQPLPVLEAKDLPQARGPMPPESPDPASPSRDPLGLARHSARRGPSIPALDLPATSVRLKDAVPDISGWRAYRLQVPPGGKVHVEVVEGRRAWFRVKAVNRWGRLEEGMLQNRIWTGKPEASYKNPSSTETKEVWFIVDTTDTQMTGDPFEVEVRRE